MKIFSLAVGITLAASSAAFAEDELAAVDQPAPMFRLPVYNAKAVGATSLGLDRYVGAEPQETNVRAVLLSFMASYCGPCKKEMPYLESLHQRYKELGLRVVMVSIDTEAEGQAKVDALIAQNKVTFPVLKDRFNLVARRWLGNQSPLPSVFFLKPDGTVSRVHRGYSEEGSKLLTQEVELALGVKRNDGARTLTASKPTP
ncbi:MAG: TlpA family protein disulfide reductase [Myxococcaceae bacterium]